MESDGPQNSPITAVLGLQTVRWRWLNSDTWVEFPESGAHVEMARACLHQHDAETETFHKLAAVLKSSPQAEVHRFLREREDSFTVEPQSLDDEENLLMSLWVELDCFIGVLGLRRLCALGVWVRGLQITFIFQQSRLRDDEGIQRHWCSMIMISWALWMNAGNYVCRWESLVSFPSFSISWAFLVSAQHLEEVCFTLVILILACKGSAGPERSVSGLCKYLLITQRTGRQQMGELRVQQACMEVTRL